MDFTDRKLPAERAAEMRICPISTIRPYALMLAPAYVYMKNNCKFVAVKAPLDFFRPEELARLAPFESLFIPEFVDQSLRFRETARAIRSLIQWSYETQLGHYAAPATFEMSDGILRLMAPLFSRAGQIEPFFITIFVNELCDLIPEDILVTAHEADVIKFERGIFASSLCVFFAMMLGYVDTEFLNQLRIEVFAKGVGLLSELHFRGIEVDALEKLSFRMFDLSGAQAIRFDHLFGLDSRVWEKLQARLARIQSEFSVVPREEATIFGAKGFLNV